MDLLGKSINEEDIDLYLSIVIKEKGILLNDHVISMFRQAVVLILNRMNVEVAFNSNITISADDIEISNKGGEIIAETVERLCNISCAVTEEGELYNRVNWNERNKAYKILLVKECIIPSVDTLFDTLLNFENEEWNPMVILCTTEDSLQKIRKYDRDDFRLFYYLCGLKIFIPDVEVKDMIDFVTRELTEKGFVISDSFCNSLKTYIEAVYPEASLTREYFAKDLIYRIYLTHYQKFDPQRELSGSDVPYSEKANLKMKAMVLSEKNQDLLIKQHIPTIHIEQTHFDNLTDSYNILLLSMSTLPPVCKRSSYCIVENKNNPEISFFDGESQLEPGTKLFISKLAEQGIKPDKIIVLTTDETFVPQKNYNYKSAIEVYSKNIVAFLTNKTAKTLSNEENEVFENLKSGDLVNLRIVDASERVRALYKSEEKADNFISDNSTAELEKYINVVSINQGENALYELLKLLNKLASEKHINLYFDLQGGSRSFMFTMFAACTLLRDKNVSVKDLFAIRYNSSNLINPIEILNSEYAIIDLVSGIRSFSRYGKVDELQQFLDTRKIPAESNEEKLINVMKKIDSYMQINNPAGFTKELDVLDENLMLETSKYSDSQFRLIVENLKDEYMPLIKPGHTVLDQIRWFGEKSSIISALTFIEDKMPDYFINNSTNPIINVSYDSELSDKQISDYCGGQSYYRPNNNIFNFGLDKKLLNTLKRNIFWDLCSEWSKKIVEKISGFYTIRITSVINDKGISFDRIRDDEDLLNSMLLIEENMGNDVWNPVTLSMLYKLVTSGSDISWADFKKEKGITNSQQKTVGDEKLSRNVILDWISEERKSEVRLIVILDYLKRYDFCFDVSQKTHQTVLERVIKIALFHVFFSGNEQLCLQDIGNILKPILGRLTNVIEKITVILDDENKRFDAEYVDDYDKNRFIYELWKQILIFVSDDITDDFIEKLVLDKTVSIDKVSKLENELIEFSKNISNVDNNDNNTLLKYAEIYIECNNGKASLKNSSGLKISDPECSYENIQLYSLINNTYRSICEKQLCFDGEGNCLCSIAGIKDCSFNWFEFSIADSVKEKRDCLDKCIRLYKALKQERNATNHADNEIFNHMDYGCTKKVIMVFVELCKKL